MNAVRRLGPWQFSLAIHGAFLAAVAMVIIASQARDRLVEIEVFENPVQATTPAPPKEIAQPQKKEIPPAKSVYGVSRKAILDETGAGETVKTGNTVATAPDDKKLDKNDPDALPIPADEFLVSEMPRLASEVRIPYPPEARRKGIQGAVVMDLLIDDQGHVRKADLVEGPGYGLNEAALTAVKGFAFKPARIAEKFVAVKIRYAYRFILER